MTIENSVAGAGSATSSSRPPFYRAGMSRVQIMAFEMQRQRELERQTPAKPPLPPEFTLPDEAVDARAEEIEMLAAVLPPNLIRDERYLARVGWSGYGFMGPLERTQLFVRAYQIAFAGLFGMSCAISADPNSPNFAVVWQMRQSADRERLPYGIYSEIGLHLFKAQRYFEELKCGTLRIPDRVGKPSWFKRKQKVLHERGGWSLVDTTFVPQYHAKHFMELPAQLRFRDRLIEFAKRTRSFQSVAFYAFIQRHNIPIEELIRRFGLDSDERAELIASLKSQAGYVVDRPPAEALPPEAFMQGCFGWFTGSSDHCVRCPLRAQCAALADRVKLRA